MNRRYRSKSGRAKLALEQNGLCYYCQKLLQPSWHADHFIPWSKGGKTVHCNLRAACPECNLKKGNKMQEEQEYSPQEYESMLYHGEDFPKARNVRTAQIGAYNCIKHRLVTQKNTNASCFVPTGVGKSEIIRSIAMGLCGIDKMFCGIWAFSPSVDLRDQLKKDGVAEYLERIGESMTYSPFQSCDNLETKPFRNDSLLDSYTTQFLNSNNNVRHFIQWAKKLEQITGKKPIALFDEGHLLGKDASWGKSAKILEDAGIPIVIVTGTPIREDDLGIPGFQLVPGESTEGWSTKTELSKDPGWINTQKTFRRTTKYRLKAHYEYSYQRAWDDGVILQPQLWFIDGTKVTSIDQLVDEKERLSEMSKESASRALRSFLLNQDTISTSVKQCIKNLRCKKTYNRKAAALVATLCDDDDEVREEGEEKLSDIHADKIKNEFRKQDPTLKVMIATSNQGCINDFKKGNYDVLIVKNMGTLGFNYPLIKVVLCLSNYRTLAYLIQLSNRGCRLLQADHLDQNGERQSHLSYDFLVPKDKAMRSLLYDFKEETGFVIEQHEVLEQEEIEKKEINEKTNKIKLLSTYEDHTVSLDPEEIRNDVDHSIEYIMENRPNEFLKLGAQGVINLMQALREAEQLRLNSPNPNSEQPNVPREKIEFTREKIELIDLNEKENVLRNEANYLIKEINLEIQELGQYPFSEFGKINPKIWSAIKRTCGFSTAQKVKNLAGIDNFEKMICACKSLISEMKNWPAQEGLDYHAYLNRFSYKMSR